jgi:hypothetical protein
VLLTGPLGVSTRKRKPLSAADLELRRQKNQESAAKRAKLQQDRKRKLEEQKQKKKYGCPQVKQPPLVQYRLEHTSHTFMSYSTIKRIKPSKVQI